MTFARRFHDVTQATPWSACVARRRSQPRTRELSAWWSRLTRWIPPSERSPLPVLLRHGGCSDRV